MLNKIFGKSGLPIKWHIEKRKLADLKRWDRNPRIIKGKPYEDLKKSIGKFGLAEPLVIQPSGLIIGGHARYEAMLDAKIEECDCYVPDKKLSDKEVEELNIRLNKNIAGEFDFDALANGFEIDNLQEYGFLPWELGIGEINDPNKEWEGMPEFKQESQGEYKAIIVRFMTEKDFNDFTELIKQPLSEKTKSIWHPKQDQDQFNRENVYSNES